MARPRIRKTADSGFTATGTRTFTWEVFDADSGGSVLSTASESIAVSAVGATAVEQTFCIRSVLESRIQEYLDANAYAVPEHYTTMPASSVGVTQMGNGTGASASTFWRGDGVWATPSGGADPWTYIVLAADFVTSSGTAVDITGMSFTPSANTRYEIEGKFLMRTATATVGPRIGLAWPTGMTDGAVHIWASGSATATQNAYGNINAAFNNANTGLTNNTQSWPAFMLGMVLAGASPSGTVKLQLLSETAGTNVTMMARSFIRHRTY